MAGPPVDPPPPLVDEIGGYWLSVELIGPRGAQIEAARELASPPVTAALPRGGRPPPGELVGRVDALADALLWVDAHAFGGEVVGADNPRAPRPGGAQLLERGLVLTALVVTAEPGPGGVPNWPAPGELALPEQLGWRPAQLSAERAPLFAAPAARIPPAAERYLVVEAGHDLWQLAQLERCQADTCLRWAQVVTRAGDRFHAGWLPAFQLIPRADWIDAPVDAKSTDPSPPRRRFALRASARAAGRVHFALFEAEGEQIEAPQGLSLPHLGSDWPPARVQAFAGTLTVTIDGQPALSQPL